MISETNDSLSRAESYVAYLLGLKDYSEKEIRDKLLKKGFPEEIADAVTEKMVSYGYIDDGRYAKYIAEKYIRTCGERKVRWEMQKRGISSEIIEEVISEIDPEVTDERLYEEFCRRYKGEETKKKVFTALAARGYEYDDIKKAYNRYNEEHQ